MKKKTNSFASNIISTFKLSQSQLWNDRNNSAISDCIYDHVSLQEIDRKEFFAKFLVFFYEKLVDYQEVKNLLSDFLGVMVPAKTDIEWLNNREFSYLKNFSEEEKKNVIEFLKFILLVCPDLNDEVNEVMLFWNNL